MKVLVIGLGSMGKRRIRNLKHLGVEEIVGCDPRADRRDEAASTYGVRTVAQIDDPAGDAEAVVISTPPDLHMRLAIDALKAGRHVFTEASVNDQGVDQLHELVARSGLVAAPSCTMRYFPGPRAIAAAVRFGRVGAPQSFVYQSGQWLADWHPWEDYRDFYVSKRATGACREIVPFELTWLVDIFGLPTTVQAFKGKLSNLDADIDDIYQTLWTFGTTVHGFLQVDVLARAPTRHFRLLGTEGVVEWDAARKAVRVFTADSGWEEHSLGAGTVEPQYADWAIEEPYIEEMRDYLAAIRGDRPFPHSFAADSAILSCLQAAEKAHQTGARIHLTVATNNR